MVRLRILLVLAVAVLAACEDGPRPDAVSQRLLDRYDIQPTGATTTQQMEVGELAADGMPWEVYLAASQRIGLDFSEHFGEPAEVHTTPVDGGAPGMRLHVLVLKEGGGTIGAWLSSEDDATGGFAIYPLDDPPQPARTRGWAGPDMARPIRYASLTSTSACSEASSGRPIGAS